MKVSFGCGKHTWPDFFCIDAVRHEKASRDPDLIFAATFAKDGALIEQIPLDDGCADEVHAYHLIEHVFAWEAPALVREWMRLLRPGGAMILECPNIMLAAQNLLNRTRDQMSMWPLYGDPSHKDPYMMHKNGFTPDTITALLMSAGLKNIKVIPPQTHGAKVKRDMRVEAVKP